MARTKKVVPPALTCVECFHTRSYELLTIDAPLVPGKLPAKAKGAIVRVRIGPEWTEEEIAYTRDTLAIHARSVTMMPRPRAQVVPDAVHAVSAFSANRVQLVSDLVESSASPDKVTLKRIVDEISAEVGL